MLYDRRDFGLLRLAGAYQWLPLAPLRALSPLKQLFHEAELLASLGLLAFSRSGEYLTLTPEGYRLLSSFDLHYQPPSKRPYSQSPALRRRLEVGAILLTCLGAGIEPALDKVERLKRQPVFLPAFALRAGDGNLMNAAGCAGFGHWGGAAYMVQYVCEEHSGFFMNNELAHLHNLASVFSERLDTPQVILFAGDSYRAVYEVLTQKTRSDRNGKKGFVDYSQAYPQLGIPACLLSCDDTGALQLSIMRQASYIWFSGYKYIHDKRGFDILPDGTHGTSGFMSRKEQARIVLTGSIKELDRTLLGKQKDAPDDDDKYAEYVTLRPGSGLTEHTMIYGATGSGKTRGFVKPFILQTARRKESMVLVDPKGEIYESMSAFLKEEGYEVRMFNLLDMENSDAWNCLSEIEHDKDLVQSIAEVIIKNTSNANERQDFWEKAELNLLMALMHYVASRTVPGTKELLPIQQRSLGAIYRMLSNESFADLERRFEALPKGHPALPPYGIFKLANRQIWGNIAIGLGNRLSVFQNPLVDKITSYNEIDLTLPGKKPCAYFCCISAQDSSLEFLSSLFFSQLFTRLMDYGRRHGDHGRLPVTVNVCLEEFCNIGKLVDFKRVLNVCRGSAIFCQIIVQSIPQLQDRYPKTEWEELIGWKDTVYIPPEPPRR